MDLPNANLMALSSLILFPTLSFENNQALQPGLPAYIQENPANIYSMLTGYVLLLESWAGSMNPDADAAVAAYLDKYPDSCCTIDLQFKSCPVC